jgi:hypothetical protein
VNRLPTFEYTTFCGMRSRSMAMKASPMQHRQHDVRVDALELL